MNVNVRKPRKSDKDVFLANYLRDANFATGFYQLPAISDIELDKPKGLIVWSKRNECVDKQHYGLMFYEFDSNFDGLNGIYITLKYGSESRISKMIEEIRKFAFVICPDYSIYGNFPNYKQIDALSRSREIGYILSTFGIKVVVNFRATYKWTYELALSGISKHQVIAVGTLGAIKEKESRQLLKNSIDALVQYICPCTLIVYGEAPTDVFMSAIKNHLTIWQYDSLIHDAFSRRK